MSSLVICHRELALLQCSAVRTATVVVAPEAAAEGPDGSSSSSSSGSSSSGALLVKISRSCYDSTVRTLQVGGHQMGGCGVVVVIMPLSSGGGGGGGGRVDAATVAAR